MNKTAISWTDFSLNPVRFRATETGKVGWYCQKVSSGCTHCYAETLNNRFGAMVRYDVPSAAMGEFFLDMKMLGKLYKEKKSSRCFIFDMTDLFLDLIPDWMIAVCFYAFLDNPHHTIQLLTKRPERAVDWHERFIAAQQTDEFKALAHEHQATWGKRQFTDPWGANIWMGTSVESGATTHRIETLRRVPAQTRYISAEPLLGAWGAVDLSGVHQVIIGGESGAHMWTTNAAGQRVRNEARWMKMEWALGIKNQCVDQGTAVFFKQQSGIRTEMDTYMVEADGSRWKWEQYPNDLIPPRELVNLPSPFESFSPFAIEQNAAGTDFDQRLQLAQAWEARAYQLEGFRAENAAIAAAWWYKALEEFRPALPITPDPRTTDWLEAERAGSDERIADLIADLPAVVDVTPLTTKPSPEPDYADPYDLPTNSKVISLWQPWATLMLIGAKQIETRSWQTPFKGTLVIHAAKKWDRDLQQIANSEPFASVLRGHGYDPNALPLGAALGAVILDRCVSVDQLSTISEQERAFGDYSAGRFGWLTSRPRPFREPLPVAGEQGLRDWSSYLAKIGKPVPFDSITAPEEPDVLPTTVANFNHVYQHWNKTTRQWDDPRYVYIGRFMPSFNLASSVFANPFKIAKDTPENRAAAIEQYRTWLKGKLADPQEGEAYRTALEGLRGKTLVCWCSDPDPAKSKACHGDVLRELLGETVEHTEPPQPEQPPTQMSLFGDEPVKKTKVYA